MKTLGELLDRISKTQAYWDGAEGHIYSPVKFVKGEPKRNNIDLVRLLKQRVPEIDWDSVLNEIEDDD